MMTTRHILHLDASRLDIWRRDRNGLHHIDACVAGKAGQLQLREYLRRHAKQPFYLLADLADEDFRLEDLPCLRGQDRRALLARRLGQAFPDTPFFQAMSLGRNAEGRRDEKFLFSAITRPHTLQPWLDMLTEEKIALTGVYIPSQLTANLEHARETGCRILVTLGKSGLRQSCHIDGKLRFSRLLPTQANSLSEATGTLAGEAEKIRQYLLGQRVVERNEHIHLVYLSTPDDLAQLPPQLTPAQYFSCRYLPVPAQDEGCRQASDAMLVARLASWPPSAQYLPAALRQHHRLRKLRLSLIGASLCTVCASLIVAAILLLAGNRHRTAQELAWQAELQSRRHYESLLATLPATPEKISDIHAVITASDRLTRNAPAIDDTFADISTVFDALPPLALHSLNWKLTDNSGGGKQPALVIAELDLELTEPDLQARLVKGLAALPNTRAYPFVRQDQAAVSSSPLFSVRLQRTLQQ